MVNRRAFFEIFFYNRTERSREMMEAAEEVWRAYMKKYGLGLDASNAVEPTYEEVREITILANAAIEMVEKQMAEAEAEEAKRKKLQKEAWDLGIYPPADMAVAELEAMVLKAMNPQPEEVEEEPVAEVPAEEVAEAVEEPAAQAEAEAAEDPATAEPEVVAAPVVESPVQVIAEEKKINCQSKRGISGGNNAGSIHLSKSGVKTIALSVPCRYIHSSSSVANCEDIENTKKLAVYMLNAIANGDKNVYFIPGHELKEFAGEDGCVDFTHPTDYGFFSMAILKSVSAPNRSSILYLAIPRRK